MKAKVEHGAKIIHVDPRFTRTSAVADIYAPVRAGSDIAFDSAENPHDFLPFLGLGRWRMSHSL